MTTADDSRRVVLDYLAAQRSGDGRRMLELLDEDVEWITPASGEVGRPRGATVVLQAMADAGARYFDLATMQVELRWIIAEGEKVVLRLHNRATAVNGRPYDNEYVWIYTVRDGRIVEIEEHTDTLRFQRIVVDAD